MERWHGKIAVVTGASAGIGLATVKQLVRHGLIVIGLARRLNVMKEETKDMKGPGEFHARECDITNEKNVIEVFTWIKQTFKSVHILVNNAGFMTTSNIEDSSTEDLENVFKINVFGLLYCTKQAIHLMKEHHTEAHIININSVEGHRVTKLSSISVNVYPASKFAVTALSESLRNELTDSKIRVTNISPGAVNTEMIATILAKASSLRGVLQLNPEDVSNCIVHALSVPPHVEIHEITLASKRV